MALRLIGVQFVGKVADTLHQSQPPKLYMTDQNNSVSALITVNSHTVRSLESMDKKVAFTAEVVDTDELKVALAQWLTMLPAKQLLKVSFELVD